MPDIDAAERVRLLVEEFEARGARYMNPGCVDEGLAVADVRAVLAELRNLRARVLDPATTLIVTVKLPKNSAHNPHSKQTGQCPFSDECTDVTGEHHSFLTGADGLETLHAEGTHVTRVERLQRSPRFTPAAEESVAEARARRWFSSH